jgi:pimeloyl-ACP methyl ester carboxylesterase
MPTVRVEDIDIYHERAGRGAPLVMIQGLGYDHRPFAWLRDALSDRFDVIVFDNRGAGLSSVPEGPYDIGRMASDTAGLLDALSVPRAHVLGVSLGGYVAQALALSHPDRVMALVLGCTCMTGDPARIGMGEEAVAVLTDRRGTVEEIARRGLRLAFSDRHPAREPRVFEQLVRWRVERPVDPVGYRAQLVAGMEFDASDRVSSIGHDTLVLHGDEDVVVPVQRGEELARAIPGARLSVLRGAGHLFFVEQVERTARLVAGWLDRREVVC